MQKSGWPSILVLSLALFSCNQSPRSIDGMDQEAWKNDKNACGGHRSQMIEDILKQKDKLLALTELEIVDMFGKPDEQELFKRNQKFYYYYIEPSRECDQPVSDHPMKLVFRFNAMGLAKEITTEE